MLNQCRGDLQVDAAPAYDAVFARHHLRACAQHPTSMIGFNLGRGAGAEVSNGAMFDLAVVTKGPRRRWRV
jgi:hypothetical protein